MSSNTFSSDPVQPSTVEDLVRQFDERVALGGVRHRYQRDPATGDMPRIIDAGRAAVRSYLARTDDTARPIASGEVLLALAVAPEALLDTHPSLRADDVYAFAATALGRDVQLRCDTRPELLPSTWAAVVTAAQRAYGPTPSAQELEAARAAMRLAVLAVAHGCRNPDALPTWATVERWAQSTSWDARTRRDWRRGLVRLVALNEGVAGSRVESPSQDERANRSTQLGIPRSALPPHAAGAAARTFAAALQRAGAVTLVAKAASATNSDPDANVLGLSRAARSKFALLRIAAPHFVPLLTTPRTGGPRRARPAPLRPETAEQLLGTIDRLLAQVVELGHLHRITTLTPACLVREDVDATLLTIAPPALTHHAFTSASLGRPVATPTVPLLQLLLDRQAEASARRSPVQRLLADTPDASNSDLSRTTETRCVPELRYTQTLVKDAATYADALRRTAYHTTTAASVERREWEEWCARADEVAARIAGATTAAGTSAEVKNLDRLLDLVSWPQLLCVGLPALRARLLRMRATLDARPSFGEHPRDDRATYHLWLERYLVLAVLCADPLRLKNVRRAWVGCELRVSLAEDGAVLSVHSTLSGSGGVNPSAALKRVHESRRRGSGQRRGAREQVRSHDWSPAIVDPLLLHDYLTQVRAERIRRARGSSYTLVAELRGEYPYCPLFLSERPAPSHEGEDDGPSALGAGAIRVRFAAALHWVCRSALGRDLPPWQEFSPQRGDAWYALFAPHVVRSLAATYWLRVRERGRVGDALSESERATLAEGCNAATTPHWLSVRTATYVSHLLNDHVSTMRRHYVAWPPLMAARLREPIVRLDWTHPRAYDGWMDRIACGATPIRWSVEAELPLPPCLTHADLETREPRTSARRDRADRG